MMEYRFKTSSDLNGHAVGNLILTSMLDITGSLKDSIKHLSKLLDVRHTVLPLSEDNNIFYGFQCRDTTRRVHPAIPWHWSDRKPSCDHPWSP